ncbi:MAG: cupin domain-containing protein [Actinomycetota bacterium]|nr:cupin domain-containing protein [Actinomycetota bacterium]
MDFDPTRHPIVITQGSPGGAPLGTSGRGRLKVLNQPGHDAGYALIEGRHPAGEPRIRDHVHGRHEETFVVLEGQYEVRLGEKVVQVMAGDYVFVPRGTPHTYRNMGPAPARVLNIISPPDGVQLLAELGALFGTTVDETLLAEIHARHATNLVPSLPGW